MNDDAAPATVVEWLEAECRKLEVLWADAQAEVDRCHSLIRRLQARLTATAGHVERLEQLLAVKA